MHDYGDVIILDDDIDDVEEFRNQSSRDHRTQRTGGRTSRVNVGGRRRPTAIIRTRGQGARRRPNAGPVIRTDTGGLSYGVIVDAAAQVLAAIQPLPAPPVATGTVNTDVSNLLLYQQALAEHAKRDEQLRTVGSLACKLFA